MDDSMAGKSWYTKWRPKTIDEYCGDEIKDIVHKRFNSRDKLPHAIYIRGPRGTGKTTFARLIGKYYLCENPLEDNTPCEQCETCKAINEILIGGESAQVECPGITEVDNTTANGKDAIQEIMDDALQPPVYTEYKIVIFDECHMITPQAQNALLKLIEDAPPHLVCIFCTTNDEKVLQTIKSRMQVTLQAKKQSVKDLADRLLYISEQEKLHVSRQALEVIVKASDRVPRESINLLEAIAKMYDGEVTLENVKKQIGDFGGTQYIDYFKAANQSLSSILVFVKSLSKSDDGLMKFAIGLNKFVVDSLYIKYGLDIDDFTSDYVKCVAELFRMYNSNDFDMLLQIVEYMNNQMLPENDARNEITLITTALRIGKIELLANNLQKEQTVAVEENKTSLYEHSKMLKADNNSLQEQLKMDINPANIKDTFGDTRQVINTQNLLDNITLPELEVPLDTAPEPKTNNINLGSAVDDFFNE